MATSMRQFLSATSSRLWGHRVLVLLFKMGVTWPMMAALMHRLPWEDIAVLCGAFCMWLCVTWAGPLCTHLQSSPADAALITSVAGMLDRVAGLVMDVPAAGAFPTSSSAARAGGSQASAGAAGISDTLWEPLAYHIIAACGSASAANSTSTFGGNSINSSNVLSAADCQSLVMGQCQAVVATFTLWVGVLLILFWVVLAEQHSKWRWWHSRSARWQGRVPSMYATTTVWAFLGMRLLYLHVLLDVPLIVLWVATSSWLRQPTLALGSYNLW